jgi:phosphopantetheinyl transferase
MYKIATGFAADIHGESTALELDYLCNISNSMLLSIKKKSYIFSRQAFETYQFSLDLSNSNINPRTVAVGHFESGKPYFFVDNKISPCDLSISHKSSFIAVGLADYPYLIGVDAEDLNQNLSLEFATFFLSESEINLIDSQGDLVLFWSFKESFFKALGIFLPFKELQIKKIENQVNFNYSDKLKLLLERQGLTIFRNAFDVQDNYLVTHVVLKKIFKLQKQIDFQVNAFGDELDHPGRHHQPR